MTAGDIRRALHTHNPITSRISLRNRPYCLCQGRQCLERSFKLCCDSHPGLPRTNTCSGHRTSKAKAETVPGKPGQDSHPTCPETAQLVAGGAGVPGAPTAVLQAQATERLPQLAHSSAARRPPLFSNSTGQLQVSWQRPRLLRISSMLTGKEPRRASQERHLSPAWTFRTSVPHPRGL